MARLRTGDVDANEDEIGPGPPYFANNRLLNKSLKLGWLDVATACVAAGAVIPGDVFFLGKKSEPSGEASARVVRFLVDKGVYVDHVPSFMHWTPFFLVVRSAETWLDTDAWRASWEPFATALLERGQPLHAPFQEHRQPLLRCPLAYVDHELKRIRKRRSRVASLEVLREVLVRHAAKMHALFIFSKREPWLLPNEAIELVLRNM